MAEWKFIGNDLERDIDRLIDKVDIEFEYEEER
jgi:hypothetical protein